jgi:hypothetical protein
MTPISSSLRTQTTNWPVGKGIFLTPLEQIEGECGRPIFDPHSVRCLTERSRVFTALVKPHIVFIVITGVDTESDRVADGKLKGSIISIETVARAVSYGSQCLDPYINGAILGAQ